MFKKVVFLVLFFVLCFSALTVEVSAYNYPNGTKAKIGDNIDIKQGVSKEIQKGNIDAVLKYK